MSNTQMVPAQKPSPIVTLRTMLDKSKEQIAQALPKHLTAERMMRVAITAVQKQPKLLECSPLSIVGSIIEASQLGLEPDGILGQAYLVPFWNGKTRQMEAQLQPGYRGLIALARRSNEISTLFSELVFAKDKFKVVKGDSPKLIHEPNYDSEDRGELRGAYAVVLYKDGGKDFEYMPMPELNKIRAGSKAKDKEGNEYGPWATHPEQMYLKCPIRRLAKRLPLSPEFQRAAVLDEYVDAGVAGSAVDSVDSLSDVARMATEQRLDSIKDRYTLESPANPPEATAPANLQESSSQEEAQVNPFGQESTKETAERLVGNITRRRSRHNQSTQESFNGSEEAGEE
jgi:recombination protein RecT